VVRLQTKLTLGFAVVLLPLAGLGYFARFVIERQARHQFQSALDDAQAEVAHEYRRLVDDVTRATRRLARDDDPVIGRVLVELGKGPLDDEQQRILAGYAQRQMRSLGFDVLEIVDGPGEVLAAGHFPGRVGDSDPDALKTAHIKGGEPRLVEERVVENGQVTPILAVEVAAEVQAHFGDAAPRVAVIGGRRLGATFLEALHHQARLLGRDGTVLAGKLDGGARAARWPRRLIELGQLGDGVNEGLARVEIVVPDDELARTLAYISWGTGALGLSALALSLLLSFVVTRRTLRGVEDVAEAARQVAKGRLDLEVGVHSRDEVGELAAAFNQMIRDLSSAREELVRAERVAAWREIAQRIAHEIKNPLTPIQMAVETLQRAQKKADQKMFDELFAESSRTILDEVARLKNIVAEFSQFARMPPPRVQPLDLKEVVESTLPLYTGAVEKQLDPAPALADRDQIVQVLLNLLENARDASGAEGKVTVRTRRSNGRVELEVADSGPGLSDEARARIFTPYFTTKTKGTGLGLAICHRIVTDHGGEIRVANDSGAVFTVSLPASP
jgi:signal transduction histidine kinase